MLDACTASLGRPHFCNRQLEERLERFLSSRILICSCFAPHLLLLQTQQGDRASPPHVLTWLQNLFAAYQRSCGSGLRINLIKNCFISTFNVLRLEGHFANTNTLLRAPRKVESRLSEPRSPFTLLEKSSCCLLDSEAEGNCLTDAVSAGLPC